MRNRLQSALAVVAGLLLVTTAAFGATTLAPGATPAPVGEASAQPVQTCVVGIMPMIDFTGGKICPNPDTENLTQADALETKKEIYDQASVQRQNNDVLLTSFGNYLNDTQSIALMEGKNAYIRALENGSTEPVARNAATEAVADYYAIKQMNIIASWNTTMTVANSTRHVARNTTDVQTDFVGAGLTYNPGESTEASAGPLADENFELKNFEGVPQSVTLVNSSAVDVRSATLTYGTDSGNATFLREAQTGGADVRLDSIVVQPPNSNFDKVTVAQPPQDYKQRWLEIETQNDEIQNQLDTFINNTYDSYQQGEINTTDLVDPYLGARDYSPENASQFQSWSLRTLTAMGLNAPENLSNIGRMNVTAGGTTYTGILMSDGNPPGGFTVGETYNASQLQGLQFVALDDGGQHELTGNFTLESAETADGEVIQTNESVTYNNITYETANTTEFQALQEQLDTLSAEINARQQELRNSGGGGGLFPGLDLGGLGGIAGIGSVGLIVAGAAAFVVLGRN